MAKHWLGMEAAATRLGISYRTLQRRIKSGRFETRELKNGSKEVLLELPDETPAAPAASETPAQANHDTQPSEPLAKAQGSSESENAMQVVSVAELGPELEMARGMLQRSDDQIRLASSALGMSQRISELYDDRVEETGRRFRNVRQQALIAWALVALMVPATAVCTHFATRTYTMAQWQAETAQTHAHRLSQQVEQSTRKLAKLSEQAAEHQATLAEAEKLRHELAALRTKVSESEAMAKLSLEEE